MGLAGVVFLLSALVYLTAMTDRKNQDDDFFVLDFAKHPEVTDAISPEPGVITF